MTHLLRHILLVSVCLLAAGVAGAQTAQTYPTRPLRMIIPFGPGGSSDLVGRIVAARLGQELGQQIVVENRTGASGNIGVELAARATPDGYTILLGNVGAMAINASIFRNFAISPMRDFIGVTLVSDTPGALGIHSSVPANTIKEFIEYAKARPGQLNYGSASPAGAQRLAFEFFMNRAGIKLAHIPYKAGAGAAAIALLSGEVVASMLTPVSFVPHLKSGRIKVIGVVAQKRVPQLPDVPTMAEAGFPELTVGSWQGIYLPKGTPQPIVKGLFAALMKVMKDPDVLKRYEAGGAVVVTSKSLEDFAAFMKSQNQFWAKLVKELGVGEK